VLTSAATVILSELSAEVCHRSVLFLVPLAQTDRSVLHDLVLDVREQRRGGQHGDGGRDEFVVDGGPGRCWDRSARWGGNPGWHRMCPERIVAMSQGRRTVSPGLAG
jgi:hypothetical protein